MDSKYIPGSVWSRDRTAVEAGMEMFHWTLTENQSVEFSQEFPNEKRDGYLIGFGILTFVGAILSMVYAQPTLVNLQTSWAVIVVEMVLGAVVFGAFALYRRLRPAVVAEAWPVETESAVFTSTGLILGGHARLWRAPDYRLQRVSLLRGRLALSFGRHGSFVIPIPEGLEQDVNEMAELLRAKADGATNQFPAPPNQ